MEALENVWLHLGDPHHTVQSWGSIPGKFEPREVPAGVLQDGGMVVRLLCAGGFSGDGLERLPDGGVWEVVSTQEKTRYVLGQRLWLNPKPPCGICPACLAGCARSCVDAGRPTSGPGWMSSPRMLHPWAVRRGVVPVPATVAPESFSWILPMARALRVRRTVAKRERVVVVGSGVQALAMGIALQGPGNRILLDPTKELALLGPLGFQQVVGEASGLAEIFPEGTDLVVVTESSPVVADALRCLGWGGVVVRLDSPGEGECFASPDKEPTWIHQRSVSGEDLVAAVSRIAEVSGFLERIPRTVVGPEALPHLDRFTSLWTVVEACAPSY